MRRLAKETPKPQVAKKCSFVLEGRVRSKKNSKQIAQTKTGRTFLKSSDTYLSWAQVAKAHLFLQKIKMERDDYLMFPMEGKLRLHIQFEMVGKQHEPDLSNLIEGPQDLLQEIGVIFNDKQIVEIEATKRMDAPMDICTIHLSQSIGV